ncbi:Uu.00g116770.m01.CDS01 [Anthostomella pinea]|uniref:Uu.00g116770.m01.CDS01 n=1 Tax=Anthostomella pinea TaxID=933095 RepID=A0AAI8VFZ9_9PEZI|nr:Uu.00g116770.m01.CDS01 [Anthostomella pinea]
MASCSDGLKICVASPWTEFEDEFSEGPMLQMHSLTWEDMEAFVTRKFQGNKGFDEQKHLYSQAASQLLADITQKANGVFLWVSVVVQHLLGLFTEGLSIYKAQEALQNLPLDLSSLYDAIWNRISPENMSDALFMMQVVAAAEGPLPWLIMWIAEEARHGTVQPRALSKKEGWRDFAWLSLKRKIAIRTRNILELTTGKDGFVDFTHRTARDWAMQPEVWHRIRSSYE